MASPSQGKSVADLVRQATETAHQVRQAARDAAAQLYQQPPAPTAPPARKP